MTGQALFDSAIFSGNKLEIEKYVYIDGDVATNGSKIEKEKGVTITGSEETSVGKTLDSITFSCSSCNADKKIKNDETWSSDTYEYKKLEIEKKTTITISGDVILYVKEDFKVEKEVTFRLLDGASLTVYVDKKVELEKKFAIEFPQGPDRPEDFVIFGTSNADTIKLYEEDKNNVYQYGDFASYIYLYNSRLEFVFPPVEYMGWTKLVSSEFIVSNKQICVLSIISSSKDSIDLQTLNLLNLKGEIIKRRKIYRKKLYLVGNFKADKVLFFSSSDKEFHVYNANLQLVRRIKVEKSVYIYGLKDLNDDKKPELLTVEGDNLVIYDDNLQTKAYFPLEICDKKHQANEIFETFIKDNKSYLNIGIGDSSFIIRYYKSKRYYFKYPVYALLWGFWYFFIWGVFKINSWRLEQENKNLELIVESRTFELQEKNKLLVKQKKEIERQSEELTTNNKRLLELNKFKEMMTGTIIHDLKNPLNTIINLSDKKGVIQSAKSMKNLVLNILDVQKYEDNKMELFFESHLLSEIMEDVVEEVQVLLEEKNIQLIENYNKNIQLEVDKTIVLRVFVNLLTNAIKFSQLNSAIEIKAAVTSKNLIMIEVIDNGMGIPENQIDLIFDKFVQADHRGLGELKSTGLGLTFCKMAIEAHCGMIKAKNRASAGAVFLFSLNGKIIPKQNPKKTPSEKADNGLSEKEMELLKPVLKKLQTIPVFEASEILLALQQIESKNLVINAWIERVKSAVFAANSQMYKHLIGKNTAS